ncbi:hypothetical protein F383_27072 [Gossypium arboreum]|uniref:Uncharacterized protein n=1 Tax=Gossypium arboreum TaxID=29729 RepID=A0A0B0P9B4_GOSAR|nr:hypothetical protein F383_27072 [Gossypium arboreum]
MAVLHKSMVWHTGVSSAV